MTLFLQVLASLCLVLIILGIIAAITRGHRSIYIIIRKYYESEQNESK
jgi:hypothetical protein